MNWTTSIRGTSYSLESCRHKRMTLDSETSKTGVKPKKIKFGSAGSQNSSPRSGGGRRMSVAMYRSHMGQVDEAQLPLPPLLESQESEDSSYTLLDNILIGISLVIMAVFLPLTVWYCVKIMQEYERAVIFRLGKLLPGGAKGPGMFFVLPCTDQFTKVDLRTRLLDIKPQSLLTKDSVTVEVDAVVYFRIFDPCLSVTKIEDAEYSTKLLSSTTLRNVLGTKTLSEILCDRDTIALSLQHLVDQATDHWGILVERVEVRDVRLPVQLQRAMAAEAEAQRESRAKVIQAEGEKMASTALKEAAEILAEAPGSMKLRYLQTLCSISGDNTSTIVFPLPIDVMEGLLSRKE